MNKNSEIEITKNNADILSSRKYGGKGEGLLSLRAIKGISVPPFSLISASDNEEEQKRIIRLFIKNNPSSSSVAVRSSALQEDGKDASYAGAFDTILHVRMEVDAILDAVRKIQSNGRQKLENVFDIREDDAMGIVVQEMVEKPDYAGVCLSQGHGSDDSSYLLINFRHGLGDALVGGEDTGHEIRVLRSDIYKEETVGKYPFLPELVQSMQKIEEYFEYEPIDTEFAVKDGTVYMLQARPLVTINPASPDVRIASAEKVSRLAETVKNIPYDDVLCDMADINPRELLGYPVNSINTNIFRRMFADEVVEEARAEIGYDPLYCGLLREIDGKPYVSMRASAYSIRPIGISSAVYDKMVSVYRERILDNPSLQDKVEFEVFITQSSQLPKFFSDNSGIFADNEKKEITDAFAAVENNLSEYLEKYRADFKEIMSAYRLKVADTGNNLFGDRILSVLQEGTKFFVKTARLAFFQKSKCDMKYGEEFVSSFLVHMDTPSEQMQDDIIKYGLGLTGKNNLCDEYGHIRAGQMNVFSVPYRDDIEKNLDLHKLFIMTKQEIEETGKNRLDGKAAMHSRLHNLTPEERQDIETLRLLLSAREQVKHDFMKAYDKYAAHLIENGLKEEKYQAADIIMPDVLHNNSDLYCVEKTQKNGTYFTRDIVEALPLVVTDDNLKTLTREKVEGKILITDHADPGYDFLLLYKPAGVITKVGGPASHIAIRVNEKSIPSCIGSGIDISNIDETRTYVLDCNRKRHHSGTVFLQNVNKDHNNVYAKTQFAPSPV